MESPQLDLWERFDFDPSCHDAGMDFDIESIVRNSPIDNFGQGFELEESSQDLNDGTFGLSSAEPSFEAEEELGKIEIDEALFQGLEGFAQGLNVPVTALFGDDISNIVTDANAIVEPVHNLLAPKPVFEDFDIAGCDLFPELSFPAIDTIKSDCMWSSTLSNATESTGRRPSGRRREFSLTLSECVDGPSSLRDVECLGTGQSSFLTGMCPLFDTPLTNAESDTESAGTDEDAIPVTSVQAKKPKIEAGRSLLLSSNRDFQPKADSKSTYANQQTYIDHCYFSVQPPSPQSVQGLLTPTESSDDDDNGALMPANIDKRKLAHAVQTLMKKNRNNIPSEKSGSVENIKFKFRMKFKSDSILAINRKASGIEKRRAVLKPAASPIVVQSTKELRSSKTTPMPKFQQSLLVNNRSNPSPKSGKSTPGSSRRASPNQDQKVRQIRDLHNSMERQRRVDLRKNFDKLKAAVPELAELDKASKLTILNKAAVYCSQITHQEARLKKEADREAAKHQQLRKKLQAFQNFFNNGVRLSSGRISMVNRASY